ncbi:hypothetical protein JNW88_11730 [Micromonospora sp. ATA32]|nr:hypothetical protein [Micromonospora sp. ATA32]
MPGRAHSAQLAAPAVSWHPVCGSAPCGGPGGPVGSPRVTATVGATAGGAVW